MPDPKPGLVNVPIRWPKGADAETIAIVHAQVAKHVDLVLAAGVVAAKNARAAGRAGGWTEGYRAGQQAGHEAGRREGESHSWALTATVAELAAAQDARDRGANG